MNELKAKCDAIEKREAERRAVEEKKHAEEIQFLKRTNQQLKVCTLYCLVLQIMLSISPTTLLNSCICREVHLNLLVHISLSGITTCVTTLCRYVGSVNVLTKCHNSNITPQEKNLK